MFQMQAPRLPLHAFMTFPPYHLLDIVWLYGNANAMIDFYNLQAPIMHSELDAADATTLPEGNNHSLLVPPNNFTVVMFMSEINHEGQEGECAGMLLFRIVYFIDN